MEQVSGAQYLVILGSSGGGSRGGKNLGVAEQTSLISSSFSACFCGVLSINSTIFFSCVGAVWTSLSAWLRCGCLWVSCDSLLRLVVGGGVGACACAWRLTCTRWFCRSTLGLLSLVSISLRSLSRWWRTCRCVMLSLMDSSMRLSLILSMSSASSVLCWQLSRRRLSSSSTLCLSISARSASLCASCIFWSMRAAAWSLRASCASLLAMISWRCLTFSSMWRCDSAFLASSACNSVILPLRYRSRSRFSSTSRVMSWSWSSIFLSVCCFLRSIWRLARLLPSTSFRIRISRSSRATRTRFISGSRRLSLKSEKMSLRVIWMLALYLSQLIINNFIIAQEIGKWANQDRTGDQRLLQDGRGRCASLGYEAEPFWDLGSESVLGILLMRWETLMTHWSFFLMTLMSWRAYLMSSDWRRSLAIEEEASSAGS